MSKKKSKLTVEPNSQLPEDEQGKTSTPNAYKIGWYDRLPFWLKATTIKYWICGAIYFFDDFGLGSYIFPDDGTITTYQSIAILVIVDAVVYGLVNHFLVRFLLDMSENQDGDAASWSMWHSKSIWALWFNILYGFVWSLCSHLVAYYFAYLIPDTSWASWMFKEPVTFALVGFAVEMAFVGLKTLAVFLYRKASHKEVC
jgi:hypothetical protein